MRLNWEQIAIVAGKRAPEEKEMGNNFFEKKVEVVEKKRICQFSVYTFNNNYNNKKEKKTREERGGAISREVNNTPCIGVDG